MSFKEFDSVEKGLYFVLMGVGSTIILTLAYWCMKGLFRTINSQCHEVSFTPLDESGSHGPDEPSNYLTNNNLSAFTPQLEMKKSQSRGRTNSQSSAEGYESDSSSYNPAMSFQ